MSAAYTISETQISPIRRITEGRHRWRVLVETKRESDSFHGRLLFHGDDAGLNAGPLARARESPVLLRGSSVEDVVALAHDLPDDRLRRLLHSLG